MVSYVPCSLAQAAACLANMAAPNKNVAMSPKAHRVFRGIAHELSNGKVVRITHVMDALASQPEEITKLIRKALGK